MSETKFKRSRVDLAEMQSHLSILDEDRAKLIRAIGALKIADEMLDMIEDLSNMDNPAMYLENSSDATDLLAKARGEHE